jgi:5-methylcytosine-specific restriction endonuclease McrA
MRGIRQRRMDAGLCPLCEQAPAGDATECLLHWAVRVGATKGYTTYTGARRLLAILEAQRFRCALSGVPLVPGRNASLDHIVPRCHNGPNDLDNLQWVTTQVNRGKWDMSLAEFLEMCHAVVAHQARRPG